MPIRVAILGTGWGSRVQIPVFRRAGLEVVSVWSPTAANAERAARQWQIARVESDPEAACGRADVDLVSVVTPPHTHEPLAAAALAAGKHVLCEKPMAGDAGAAARMVEAAARQPRQLALIDHELRFHPLRRRLRELLRSGYVGRPLAIEAALTGGGRLGSGWRWNWWSRADRGGGVLGATGSHLVDLLQWLFARPVERVWARLETAFTERADADGRPRPVTADELATLVLELADGPAATLRLSAVSAGPGNHRLRVDGSEGALVLDGDRLTGIRADGTAEDLSVRPGVRLAPLRSDEWTVGTYHLARSVAANLEGSDRGLLAEAADFAAGLEVQRVLDAARESARSGGWAEPGG